jgi:hypothetical protein
VSDLIWTETPELRRPLLLIAFEGIFDAAESATSALRWITERAEKSSPMAEIDPERFLNFQEVRPMARLAEGGNRVIDWPKTEVKAVRTASNRDLVVMTGVEPHLRWKTFSDHVVEVARRSRCEMVVTVGALVAMVPHTRPFAVTASAIHPDLARRLNLSKPTYEGPTSLIGVLNERLERSNIPVIALRVAVPHYVPGPPNPKATRALLRRLQHTTGVPTSYEELDREVSDWSNRVDQAVASDAESEAYVARLERQVDSDEELLPSGDDLAAELEAFLRDQNPDSDDDAAEETGDPGDTGDAAEETGDPGDTGDTAEETGDPGDTGDTAEETGDPGDTGDEDASS